MSKVPFNSLSVSLNWLIWLVLFVTSGICRVDAIETVLTAFPSYTIGMQSLDGYTQNSTDGDWGYGYLGSPFGNSARQNITKTPNRYFDYDEQLGATKASNDVMTYYNRGYSNPYYYTTRTIYMGVEHTAETAGARYISMSFSGPAVVEDAVEVAVVSFRKRTRRVYYYYSYCEEYEILYRGVFEKGSIPKAQFARTVQMAKKDTIVVVCRGSFDNPELNLWAKVSYVNDSALTVPQTPTPVLSATPGSAPPITQGPPDLPDPEQKVFALAPKFFSNSLSSAQIDSPLIPDLYGLTTLNRTVKGYVADGVTPLIIRFNLPSLGQGWRIGFNGVSGGSIVDKTTRKPLSLWQLFRPSITDEINKHTFKWSAVATSTLNPDQRDGVCFGYLEALSPEQLIFDPGSSEIEFQVTATQGNAIAGSLTLKIRKPPLILVHGILADNSTWGEDLIQLLKANGRQDSATGTPFVLPISYASISTSTLGRFDMLARNLDYVLRASVEDGYRGVFRDWAFTRYDIIGHSQGGVLARMLCQVDQQTKNATFAVNTPVGLSNFYRGRFRRLITVGSPHNGSTVVSYSRALMQRGNKASQILGKALDFILLKKFDPFEDQIKQINDPKHPVDSRIPVRCIRTIIAPPTNTLPVVDQASSPLVYKLAGFDGVSTRTAKSGYDIVIPLGSDGVVDFNSQVGGKTINTTVFSPFISHASTKGVQTLVDGTAVDAFFGTRLGESQTQSVKVATVTSDLLDGPKINFGPFKLPTELPTNLRKDIRDFAAKISGGGEIEADNETVNRSAVHAFTGSLPGSEQQIRLRASDTIVEGSLRFYSTIVGDSVGDGQLVRITPDPQDPLNATLWVDDAVMGDVVIFATYRTPGGQVRMSEPFVIYDDEGQINGIEMSPGDAVLSHGDYFEPTIFRIFADGQKVPSVFPERRGISFVSSAPGVIEILPGLQCVARSTGVAVITATWNGFTTSCRVTVVANSSLSVRGLDGKYYGVMKGETSGFQSSGDFTLQVLASRNFSGQLRIGGVTYRLAGKLDLDHQFSGRLVSGAKAVHVNFSLQPSPDGDRVQGTVTSEESIIQFSAFREAFSNVLTCPFAGNFTLTMNTTAGHRAEISGFACLTVANSGSVKIVGRLPNDMTWTSSSMVCGRQGVAVYNAYAKGGFVVGELGISGGDGPLTGSLSANVSNTVSGGKVNAFAGELVVLGRRFVKLNYQSPFHDELTSVGLTFKAFGQDRSVVKENSFVLPSKMLSYVNLDKSFQVSVNSNTGLVSGWFLEAVGNKKKLLFNGVIIQRTGSFGIFQGLSPLPFEILLAP